MICVVLGCCFSHSPYFLSLASYRSVYLVFNMSLSLYIYIFIDIYISFILYILCCVVSLFLSVSLHRPPSLVLSLVYIYLFDLFALLVSSLSISIPRVLSL